MTELKTRRGLRWLIVMAMLTLSACRKHTELSAVAAAVPFKTLDGQKFSLSELPGSKLVNFWSTSCGICLEEMPDLVELHEDYKSLGFTVIAVAMPSDRPDQVVEMSKQRNLTFPVALDIDGQVLAAFETVKGTPTSYLIDAKGFLRGRYVGRIEFDGLREKLDEVLTIGKRPSKPSHTQVASISVNR